MVRTQMCHILWQFFCYDTYNIGLQKVRKNIIPARLDTGSFHLIKMQTKFNTSNIKRDSL